MDYLIVASKEVKEQLRTKKTMALLILLPLILWIGMGLFYAGFFSMATPGGGGAGAGAQTPLEVYMAIEDQGWGGDRIQSTIQALAQPLNIKIMNVEAEAGERLTREGKISLFIYVSPNFTKSLESSAHADVDVWLDQTSIRASTVASVIAATLEPVIESPRYQLMVRQKAIYSFSFGFNIVAYILTVMAFVGPMPVVTTSFAGERERKSLEALLVTPVTRLSILIGKLVSALIFTALYLLMNFIGILYFNESLTGAFSSQAGVAVGQIALTPEKTAVVLGAVALTVLAAISVGIVVSSLAKSVRDAEVYYQVVYTLSVFALMPTLTSRLEDWPPIAQLVVQLIPFSHGQLLIADAVVYAKPFSTWIPHILYLLAFSVAFLLLGAKLFGRESVIEARKAKRKAADLFRLHGRGG